MRKLRLCVAVLLLASPPVALPASAANYGHTLYSSPTIHVEYSRVIQLANGRLLAVFNAIHSAYDGRLRFYESSDRGASFDFVTEFTDPTYSFVGAPTLLEASPGRILLAYNIDTPEAELPPGQIIKVWESTDGGASWRYLATVEEGENWCWEPELSWSSDGKIQLYYSFAGTTMSMLQQVIVRRESSDGGITWGSRITSVGDDTNHVGMPRVVEGDGTYYMAVEYYEGGLGVHVVKGDDGKTWSSVASAPRMDKDDDGWMASTPALTYSNGALIGMGKMYLEWPLYWTFDENNHNVVLYSRDGGETWKEMAAPFQIQATDFSSNWSPTLLPLLDTEIFLITNSDTVALNRIQYDTGPGIPLDPVCSNGVDDDGDTFVDYPLDPGCEDQEDFSESDPNLVCDNGEDDDGDTFVDYLDDPGCFHPAANAEDSACQDGNDNDRDGKVDFDGGLSILGYVAAAPDPQCTYAWQNDEQPCGVGAELALIPVPLMWLHRRRRGVRAPQGRSS